MTLQELRTIVADLDPKIAEVYAAASEVRVIVAQVRRLINPNNPYAETINIDQLVALQTPLYLAALTRLETATDALGTDALH